MKGKRHTNNNSEIDFVSSSTFQRSIKKSKLKQIILYTFISTITLFLSILVIHLGTEYLINYKIEKEHNQERDPFEPTKGAGISISTERFSYNTFSAIGETTIYKRIGNRQIVWDTVTKKYPVIGDVQLLNRGSGMSEVNTMDLEANRVIRYNQLNNERIIDFYYPNIAYNYLPQELEIATELDKNKLIEIALSFNEPISLQNLGQELGYKNVDWLWVNKKSKIQMNRMEQLGSDSLKVENGQNAYGFHVSSDYPYDENPVKGTNISGVIISGTPQELKRFLDMPIIRASVIGVTIDKY